MTFAGSEALAFRASGACGIAFLDQRLAGEPRRAQKGRPRPALAGAVTENACPYAAAARRDALGRSEIRCRPGDACGPSDRCWPPGRHGASVIR